MQSIDPNAPVVRFNNVGMRYGGGPEVLRWEEVEVPQPALGEARVRHNAVGLNFIDAYHRSGLYPVPLPSGIGHFDQDRWQLFHTDVDRSEAHDLADQHPDKLKELIDLWFAEAERYQILPLNDLAVPEMLKLEYHVPIPADGRYVYYPHTTEVQEASAAAVAGTLAQILPGCDPALSPGCVEARIVALSRAVGRSSAEGVADALGIWPLLLAFVLGAIAALLGALLVTALRGARSRAAPRLEPRRT